MVHPGLASGTIALALRYVINKQLRSFFACLSLIQNTMGTSLLSHIGFQDHDGRPVPCLILLLLSRVLRSCLQLLLRSQSRLVLNATATDGLVVWTYERSKPTKTSTAW